MRRHTPHDPTSAKKRLHDGMPMTGIGIIAGGWVRIGHVGLVMTSGRWATRRLFLDDVLIIPPYVLGLWLLYSLGAP